MTSQQSSAALNVVSRYLPLLLWLAFISFASSDQFSAANTSRIVEPLIRWLFPRTSPHTLATLHFIIRKAAHFTEYAILALLAARAFRGSRRDALRRRWLVVTLALLVVYALIDEYHQSFVPSRTASIFDSLIDMTGGLTMLLILRLRQRRVNN